MTRRKLILGLLAMAFFAIVGFFGVLWWTTPTSGVHRGVASRIQKGMAKNDVVRLIGLPPEIPASLPPVSKWSRRDREAWAAQGGPEVVTSTQEWSNDNGFIIVGYDGDDRVVFAQFVALEETLLDKIRRWLHMR